MKRIIFLLNNGGIVALNSDTISGLFVKYDDNKALEKIFKLKKISHFCG